MTRTFSQVVEDFYKVSTIKREYEVLDNPERDEYLVYFKVTGYWLAEAQKRSAAPAKRSEFVLWKAEWLQQIVKQLARIFNLDERNDEYIHTLVGELSDEVLGLREQTKRQEQQIADLVQCNSELFYKSRKNLPVDQRRGHMGSDGLTYIEPQYPGE